jgi:hypothetical protein
MGLLARTRFAAGSGAAVALLLCTASARAAPSARLVYVREPEAATCPDEQAVRAAVAARLGYDPFLPYARATMVAEVKKRGRDYTVAVKLIDENSIVRGGRELVHVGEPCSELVDLMALSMSIAIDPLSMSGPRIPEPATAVERDAEERTAQAPEPERAAPPAPPPEEPDAPTRAAVPTATHLDLGLGPAISLGTAPAPAVGARLGTYLSVGRFGVFLEAQGDLPASGALGRGRVRTSIVQGTLGACYGVPWLFGCALGSFGALSASSEGILAPKSDTAAHATLGLRVGTELPLTPAFALRAQLDGLGVLTPHRFALNGTERDSLGSVALTGAILGAVRFF